MPYIKPAPNLVLDDSTFLDPLKAYLDGQETTVDEALDGKAPIAAVRGSIRRCLWDGSNYLDDGAVVTAGNRPAGTYREFAGPADPNALGLMVIGDVWIPTS